MTTILR